MAARFAPHDGQRARPLRENATRNSKRHFGQTARAKPAASAFRGENPPYGATITYYLRRAAPSPVRVEIRDEGGRLLRSLETSGEAGLHQVQWNLEPDDADQRLLAARAVTFSERQRARRVSPGTYTVSLAAGGAAAARPLEVRSETDAVRVIGTRK